MTYIEDMADKLADCASDDRPRRRLDHRRADRRRAPGDPDPVRRGDRRSPDRQCARDGQGRRRARDPAGQFHARRARRARSRRWRWTRSRSTMPRRGRCRSAARTPRATLPTSSSAIGNGVAPVARRTGAQPARHRRRAPDGSDAGMMKALGTDIGTIHFVGIGGIGMSGIAEVMHQPRLQGAGLGRRRRLCRREAAQGGHPGQHRPFAPTISAMRRSWSARPRSRTAIPRSQAAAERRLPARQRAEMLAELMRHAEDGRGRRHPRQDHDDLDDRGAARQRRHRPDGHQRRDHQPLRLQRAARQKRLVGDRGRRERRQLPPARRHDRGRHQHRSRASRTLRQLRRGSRTRSSSSSRTCPSTVSPCCASTIPRSRTSSAGSATGASSPTVSRRWPTSAPTM